MIHWHRGVLAVAALSSEGCELLASARIWPEGGLSDFTAPVLAGGLLYLRATTLRAWDRPPASTLICLDLRRK